VQFRTREHSITADLGRLKEARDFAERAAADFGLDVHDRYAVKLAMSEAVTNAIRHGSSSSRDPVHLLAVQEGDALVFEVRDTGRFVPRVPRRGQMPERGRGLEFLRRLMDEVALRPGELGTLLRFAKRR
jgi:anti-sigma regulatory factor (Ser/Thr protein kinase)